MAAVICASMSKASLLIAITNLLPLQATAPGIMAYAQQAAADWSAFLASEFRVGGRFVVVTMAVRDDDFGLLVVST